MLTQSSVVLRSNYDKYDEMAKLSQEKREDELSLLAELLRREENRIAGAKIYTANEMVALTEKILNEW